MNGLTYQILRGKDKIGANLLEFVCGGTKLLVEFGSELDNEQEVLTAQEEEIINSNYDACIISHYHGDHAGKIALLKCPVFMGEKCKAVMDVLDEYTNGKLGKMPQGVKIFKNGVPFEIGSISITPYLCDHSAADAYMLLFEGGGSKILYTGDFRSGGRKDFDKLLGALPSGMDVLITEGTNLVRPQAVDSEAELEMKAVEIMKSTDKPVFVLQSSANFDRLVSFYRAAKRAGRRFYTDDYQAAMCGALGGKIPHPDEFNDVFAFAPKILKGQRYERFNSLKNKASRAAIGRQNNYCMMIRTSHLKMLQSLARKGGLSGSVAVYSLWEGYKAKEDMRDFLGGLEALGITTISLHASGHADKATIDRLIERVKPAKIEYIHTEAFR